MFRMTVYFMKNVSSKNTSLKCLSIRNASTVNISDVEGWESAAPFESLPGPKPLPLIGNLHRFVPGGEFYNKPLAKVYQMLWNHYGNILNLRGIPGKYDLVMIFDPEIIQKVYRSEGLHPIRYGFETVGHYRTQVRKEMFPNVIGLATSQGEKWHYIRSRVNQPMLHPKTVGKYVKPVDEISQEFINMMLRLRNKKNEMPDDFWQYITRWALESISRIAMDTRLGCLEDNLKPEVETLIKNILLMFKLSNSLDIEPSIWKIIRTPGYHKMMRVLDYITLICSKYINEAVERMKHFPETKSEDDLSVLEKLIKIDKEVASVMTTEMLMVGVDTTSSTVAMLLYYLATNQDKQDILREELTRIIPNKHSPITDKIRQSMPYLRACIKESLRLMPVAVGGLRISPRDIVLGGYKIPKGTALFLGNLALSIFEKEFPNPDRFIPERWLVGKKTYAANARCPVDIHASEAIPNAKDAHPFAYLPFGFGPRSCIGRRFGELEIEVLVSKLIRDYRIEWNYGEMEVVSRMINTPVSPLKYKITEI